MLIIHLVAHHLLLAKNIQRVQLAFVSLVTRHRPGLFQRNWSCRVGCWIELVENFTRLLTQTFYIHILGLNSLTCTVGGLICWNRHKLRLGDSHAWYLILWSWYSINLQSQVLYVLIQCPIISEATNLRLYQATCSCKFHTKIDLQSLLLL